MSSFLSQPETVRRDKEKCEQCRKDKQKCTPQDRDWANGEKCGRCRKMSYECGPSLAKPRAPRTARTKSQKEASQPCRRDDLAEALFTDDVVVVGRHTISATSTPASLKRRASRETFLGRPLPTPFGAEGDGAHSDSSAPSSQHDIAVPTAKGLEAQVCRLVARLGDQLATKQLFLSELLLCDTVTKWIGCYTKVAEIRQAIVSAVEVLEEEFQSAFQKTTTIFAHNLGPHKEKLGLKAQGLQIRFASTTLASLTDGISTGLMKSPASTSIEDMLHQLAKRKSDHSVADALCGAAGGRSRITHGSHPNSEEELVESYSKASQDITDVLSSISMIFKNVKQRDLLFGPAFGPAGSLSTYLPCHLAVRHASAAVSLKLCKRSPAWPEEPWELDYLLRTPLHCALYAGRIEIVQAICELGHTVVDVGPDIFGLTPLAIAACKNDVRAFALLWRSGASIHRLDTEDRSVVALAARNGCQDIVNFVLSTWKALPFSPQSELAEAIQAGHKHIADSFIAYYNGQPYSTDNQLQIDSGITAAKDYGFDDVLAKLVSIKPSVPIASMSSQALDDLTHEQYLAQRSDEADVYPEDDTLFDPNSCQTHSFLEEQFWRELYDVPSQSSSSSGQIMQSFGSDYSCNDYIQGLHFWQERPHGSSGDPG